jgi:hypothetical protein
MPVSIEGRGNSTRLPGSNCSNCMKTLGAVIVKNFRTGSAGTGIAHGPEVVRGRDADDSLVREPSDLLPQGGGIIVFGVNRHHESVLGEPQLFGNEVPGELYRQLLEVVAKGEVAEHLKEGVVPGRVSDVLQVVVLASRTHALLSGDGAPVCTGLLAGKDVLELHHAGVGEKQGGIVPRDQRRRRHDLVIVTGEIVQKSCTNLVGGRHPGLRQARFRLIYAPSSCKASPECRPKALCSRLPNLIKGASGTKVRSRHGPDPPPNANNGTERSQTTGQRTRFERSKEYCPFHTIRRAARPLS